jgi:hypothetical protein
MAKQKLYETMIDRMKKASDAGFHLEANWLAYAVFEDRTRAMLTYLGEPPEDRAGIAKKIRALRKRARASKGLAVYFNGDVRPDDKEGHKRTLLKSLKRWVDSRNELVHAMASGGIDQERLDQKAKTLSDEAGELVAKLTTVGRRIKKHADKL